MNSASKVSTSLAKMSFPQEINVFIEEIIMKISESLDPDFIFLAGSFGKESWLYSEGKLISDFEFVFVSEKRWPLKKKKSLLKNLNKDYPYDINLKGYLRGNIEKKIISNYSSKNPGYISLDFFDTFYDPKIIYSKNEGSLEIDCSVDEIPVWEAWRLYVNRMGDILKLNNSQNGDMQNSRYIWLKAFESTADSYCILNGIYEKNISKRIEIFNHELIENDPELSQSAKESFPYLLISLVTRQKHDLSNFDINISSDKFKDIVISWMDYFEGKLAGKEGIQIDDKNDFYNNYMTNRKIQKKYLGFNGYFSKLASNGIRLLVNPFLINFNFKWYANYYSWRHIILLSVSAAFRIENIGDEYHELSKKLLGRILNEQSVNDLSKNEFLELLIKYWKLLR